MLPVISEEESYAASLKNELVGIQSNLLEDPFGWRVLVGEGVAEKA